jgi:hypothetical protein
MPPETRMAAHAETDLPLLEVLAAAPGRLVDAEKLEPLALLMVAHRRLGTEEHLAYSPANGQPASAPNLRKAFRSALRYRAVYLSGDRYGLTEDGALYLQALGVGVDDETRRLVADRICRPAPELQAEADQLLTR